MTRWQRNLKAMKKRATIADLTPAALVSKLGLSRSYAYELVNRVKTPSLEIAVRIENAFGVPAAAWMAPAEQGAKA